MRTEVRVWQLGPVKRNSLQWDVRCMLLMIENHQRNPAKRQPWSMADFVLSAPGNWQESPAAPWLGSPDRPQKVRLVARGTSAPRRTRANPRQAVLTTRCADQIRNPVLAGPAGRTRRARYRPSPTAAGLGLAPDAAVRSVRPGARGSARRESPECRWNCYPYHLSGFGVGEKDATALLPEIGQDHGQVCYRAAEPCPAGPVPIVRHDL